MGFRVSDVGFGVTLLQANNEPDLAPWERSMLAW